MHGYFLGRGQLCPIINSEFDLFKLAFDIRQKIANIFLLNSNDHSLPALNYTLHIICWDFPFNMF